MKTPIFLSLFIATAVLQCHQPAKMEKPKPEESISHDFDFAIGEWKVTNKRRKEWLNNNNEWYEFPATARIFKHLDGMMILDEFYTERNGQRNVGGSFRVYNKNTGEWSIYFASTAYPDMGLIPQVKGKFIDGVGEFFGEEDFNGKKVKLRFFWKKNVNGSPYWEQAYFDENKQEWETNWTMNFSRIK